MILYADIVLLENLCINYIILLITGKILKSEIKVLRLVLASVIGGIYAVISYIVSTKALISVIIKIFISLIMIKISFNSKSIKQIIYEIITFYLITFGLGGCVFAIMFSFGNTNIIIKNGTLIGISSVKILIIGIVFGSMIITKTVKIIKNILKTNSVYGRIRIKINNKEIETSAMLDTGNLLVDPISKIPVVIVEKNKLKNIISEDILNISNFIGGGKKLNTVSDEYISKIKLIPFSSVGEENGMLVGIKADEMIIELDNRKYITEDVIVAIYNKKFETKGNYSALLGLEILERSKRVNEYIANIKGEHKYNLCKIYK